MPKPWQREAHPIPHIHSTFRRYGPVLGRMKRAAMRHGRQQLPTSSWLWWSCALIYVFFCGNKYGLNSKQTTPFMGMSRGVFGAQWEYTTELESTQGIHNNIKYNKIHNIISLYIYIWYILILYIFLCGFLKQLQDDVICGIAGWEILVAEMEVLFAGKIINKWGRFSMDP